MGKIEITDHRVVYSDEKGEQTLLDFWDCISNKSKISLLFKSEKGFDVLKMITGLQEDHEKITSGERAEDICFYTLIDFLVIRVLMKTSMPLNIVQIGSMSGILSYHLAVLAGMYNPESHLCCVCNAVGNESGNYWLDRIAMVEKPPKLSMLAADYDYTQLQSESFDLVVVNGTEYFENPYDVLQEAGRLVKQDGAVLCYSYQQPLLSDCFRLIFGECEEYGSGELDNDGEVLWTINTGNMWAGYTDALTESEVTEYLDKIQKVLEQESERSELRTYISQLDNYIEKSIEQKQVNFKVRLIEMKGRVLNKMYQLE